MSVATTQELSSSGAAAEPEANHILVLDGLRGLAILLVMQHHFWGLAFGLGGRQATIGVDRYAARVFGVGWCGVDLFFVLSGFLITGILYGAKHSNFYFRNFYARRFLRIFPLYYAFLLLIFIVWPQFEWSSLRHFAETAQLDQIHHSQLWYWSYMINIGSGFRYFHAEVPIVHSQFWSLAVEEQFYLVWPLLVLLLSRRTMMTVCGGLVVGALVFRYVLVDPSSASWANFNAAHVLLPARVDTFALGSLLALALRGGTNFVKYKTHALAVGGVALTVLIVFFVRHHGLSALDKDVQTIGFSALALLFAALLVLAVASVPASPLHRLFTSSGLRMLGRYSYAIYVFHLLFAFELAGLAARHGWARTVFGSQIPFNAMFSATCTAAVIVLGWLSWHLFEKQVLKLKRYVPYGRSPAAAAPTMTGDRTLSATT
jgi:peptidoglycan/LPS O-acetylase OafA/YrhL